MSTGSPAHFLPTRPLSVHPLRPRLHSAISKGSLFAGYIQDKDDTQGEIDQDQPLLGQTLLQTESTPSRDNIDIIIDATLFSENRAEVRNRIAEVLSFA